MKLKVKMYWAAASIAALLRAGGVGWKLLPRAAPAAPVAVAQGEVEMRVAGPGTVQARVPVTVAARISAQVLSVHADHGEPVKRGDLIQMIGLDVPPGFLDRFGVRIQRQSSQRRTTAQVGQPACEITHVGADVSKGLQMTGNDVGAVKITFVEHLDCQSQTLQARRTVGDTASRQRLHDGKPSQPRIGQTMKTQGLHTTAQRTNCRERVN